MRQQESIETQVNRLLSRLDVRKDGVVVVHEGTGLPSIETKGIYDSLVSYADSGTLSIVGDLSFNSNVNHMNHVPVFSTQQRLVLASGKLFQLYVLEDEISFATHPSQMIASKGKFSKFFARQTKTDFPYGERSLFEDWYDLNATLIFVGKIQEIPEIRYIASLIRKPIIKVNSSVREDEVLEYLDFDIDVKRITEFVFESNLLLHETLNDTIIYGVTLKNLKAFIEKHDSVL